MLRNHGNWINFSISATTCLKIEDFRMVFYHPAEGMESDTKKDTVIAKERT